MPQPARPEPAAGHDAPPSTTTLHSDGTRLAVTAYPHAPLAAADPPATRSRATAPAPVLLIHGLAGYAGEWDALARLLRTTHHVVAYDARGHGASDRRPPDNDLSRAAHARDAIAVVEQLGLQRPVLVGQSIGGITALLAAAARPDLVRALVLVEAGPAGLGGLPQKIGTWLDSWPVPFASHEAAAEFFGGGPAGLAWARGLEEHPDGLHPRFDRDVLLACTVDGSPANGIPDRGSYWHEWEHLRCPTLVVRGEQGTLSRSEVLGMRTRRPDTRTVTVEGARHDVHLDRPEALHGLIEGFLHA